MSPLAHLHARFDGPIPRAEELAALAAERLGQASARAARVTVRVVAVSANAVRDRMGHVMERVTIATGCCTESDLARFGFTPAQIAEHGTAARSAVAASLAPDDPIFGGAA
ncbi:MAG: hypothetical protein ACRC67_18155 [Inquilinus sp.]|uniref:hypothetical protein n=1 Tax=Inquilinus sp. TaxID=1932117 RepID=UPI003F3FFD98